MLSVGSPAIDASANNDVDPSNVVDRFKTPSESWLAAVRRGLVEREYWVSVNSEGLQAPNRRQNLRSYFDGTGVRVVDRTAQGSPMLLGLRLSGWGRGDRLMRAEPGEVTSDRARVEIVRPGIAEWFVNSPAGLEHGFTVAVPPTGTGLLVLELSVEGAEASLENERVIFRALNGRRLEYGHLEVFDAAGEIVPARLVVPAAGRLQLVVNDRDALYPLTLDPLLSATADAQLESNQAAPVFFGEKVGGIGDVNGDGYGDIAVGATRYDAGQINEGAAFVFYGSATGITSGNPATADSQIESNQDFGFMGSSFAGADVNGDGYSDLLVSAASYNAGKDNEGIVLIFLGSSSGIVANGNPSNADTVLESNWTNAGMGSVWPAAT